MGTLSLSLSICLCSKTVVSYQISRSHLALDQFKKKWTAIKVRAVQVSLLIARGWRYHTQTVIKMHECYTLLHRLAQMLRVRRDATLTTLWPCGTLSASCVTTEVCVRTQITTAARESTCCAVRVCSVLTQRLAPGSSTETTGRAVKGFQLSWSVRAGICVEQNLHNRYP